jgi:hypothetical protein
MGIPRKPQKALNNIDEFISGAKASNADRQTASIPKPTAGKKMFSARLDPETVKKIKVYAGLSDMTKEEIAQAAFDLYFADKNVPT